MTDKMTERAVQVARKLKLLDSVVDGLKENRLYYSERQNSLFPAVLYWLDNKPELAAKARRIEEETGCKVLHVILTHLKDGDMYDYIVLSANENEWPMEDDDLKHGYVLSYCVSPYCEGEMGTIKIRPIMGGLARIE